MAKAKPLPPLESLREHFRYEPDTGALTRLKQCGQRGAVGKITRVNSDGYLVVRFQGQLLRAHRIAWKLMTGEEPPDVLDHINRNRTDNRWANLRSASHQQSMANRGRRRSTEGKRGTTRRRDGRWQAKGCLNNVSTYLGTFKSAEEAHQAYVRWSLDTFGVFSIYAEHAS